MLKIGKFNKLKISEKQKGGAYLTDGKDTVYLPKIDVPSGTREGDELNVFIYNDSKDSLKATTTAPIAELGDFACLTVKSVTDFGAFLDWGIEKDLFVPVREQYNKLYKGDNAIVYVILNYEENGVIGTTRLRRYFHKDIEKLKNGQKVELLVYSKSKLGMLVIIDNKYPGLIYKNEIFEKIEIGDKRTGYIKKLREDNKIDVSLKPQGYKAVINERTVILDALKNADGFLPLNDNSDPGQIKKTLNMSKKLFKKTIGGLFRNEVIIIDEDGIYLSKKKKRST